MRLLNGIFFLLTLVFFTGGSAAMARNDYGLTLMAISMFGLGFASIIGCILSIVVQRRHITQIFEYALLAIVFFSLASRIIFIKIQYLEYLFSIASLAIAVIYIFNIRNVKDFASGRQLVRMLNTTYLSIVGYLLSLAMAPINLTLSTVFGISASVVLILSLVLRSSLKTVQYKGRELRVDEYLSSLPNQSMVLITFFIIASIYSAGVTFKIIPDIHSSKLPDGYYELVKQAESGEDIPVDGKFKFETYQEKMERFIENRGFEY